MADIKTRLVNKGDVKTIDRAANLTSRLRSAEVRTKDDYKIEDYSKRIFEMYDGEAVKVKLECKNEFMKYVIDRFGEDVDTKPRGEEHFIANVEVSLSPNFYAWVFRFAGGMKILSPKRAVNKMSEMARKALG